MLLASTICAVAVAWQPAFGQSTTGVDAGSGSTGSKSPPGINSSAMGTNATPNLGAPSSGVSTPAPRNRPNYSGMLDVTAQTANARAPAWLIVPRLEIDEILTDNVRPGTTTQQSDLISRFSAGGILSVDTPHLTAYTDYTATYAKYLNATDQDRLSQRLFSTARATFIPDYLYMDVHGSIDTIARDFGGTPNPALTSKSNDLQTYVMTVSPFATARLGDIGYAQLRYAGSWVWFGGRKAPPVPPPPGLGGTISDASQHQVRADFTFPGTFTDRLYSDISLSGDYSNSPGTIGIFRRNFAMSINEYQITRSWSLIGSGGYENISQKSVSGKEGVWSAGARWRPNADSSVVLTYGRYDLANDFAGEAFFRVTPFTVIYAAYTNSITTSQASLISNNASAILPGADNSALLTEPQGLTGVTFEQNPVISLVNKAFVQDVNSGTGVEADQDINLATGLPLSSTNNFFPVQDNIFRAKSLRGIVYRDIGGSVLSIEGFHIEQKTLTVTVPPAVWETTNGATATYALPISPYLVGVASSGYRHTDLTGTDTFNASASLVYQISATLTGRVRYDFIDRSAGGSHAAGYIQNALTVMLQASF